MSMIGGLGGALSSYMQQWQQNLFNKIDANGDGSITKSELEQAVTGAGGTTTAADALFADLDPSDTGSVDEQQFEQNLPPPSFGPEMGAQLIAYQAQNTDGSASIDPSSSFANALFSQITNGGSTLTQSELEKAVTATGGTTQAADALYAQLDPNDTGSVDEQQFAQNLPTSIEASSASSGSSAADALAALLQNFAPPAATGPGPIMIDQPTSVDGAGRFANALFSQLTDGGSTLTQSQLEQAVTSAGGTKAAADALYAQLDPNNTGSVDEQQFAANLPRPHALFAVASQADGSGDTGDTAADAMAALLQKFAPPPFPGAVTSAETGWWGNASVGSANSGGDNSAQAALQALAQSLEGSSQTASASGNSAQDALAALLQADDSSAGTSSFASLPLSPFNNMSPQMLSMLVQLQAQNSLM